MGQKYLTSCFSGDQGWVKIGTKVAVEIWCEIKFNEFSLNGQFFYPSWIVLKQDQIRNNLLYYQISIEISDICIQQRNDDKCARTNGDKNEKMHVLRT